MIGKDQRKIETIARNTSEGQLHLVSFVMRV